MTRSRSALLAAALALAVAVPAHADVWQRAITGAKTIDKYDELLAKGDTYAQAADTEGATAKAVAAIVDKALAAYAEAAALRPTEGEPYFRIASVVESFFTDCRRGVRRSSMRNQPMTCPIMGGKIDIARGKQAVAAWDAFEARSPLDPRVVEALFSRAILRTKLVDGAKDSKESDALLQGALADYLALLDRKDGLTMSDPSTVWGNLAETYMMLGRLEEAVDAYRTAVRGGSNSSTAYGLAVALDRDGSPTEAMEVIRAQGRESVLLYRQYVANGDVFYVPSGEEHYYLALIYEAFDRPVEAIAEWNAFLRSGASPRYQARARQHLDALVAKQKSRPARPRPFDPFDF